MLCLCKTVSSVRLLLLLHACTGCCTGAPPPAAHPSWEQREAHRCIFFLSFLAAGLAAAAVQVIRCLWGPDAGADACSGKLRVTYTRLEKGERVVLQVGKATVAQLPVGQPASPPAPPAALISVHTSRPTRRGGQGAWASAVAGLPSWCGPS